MGEIKKQISDLQSQAKRIQDQIEALQATCKHDVGFTEGLSIIACIHPVLFCNECGFMKPVDHDGPQFIVSGC